MSWSKVQICNMALGQAGSTLRIETLTYGEDETVPMEAQLCLAFWSLALEATGRSHDWNCLKKRVDISASITTAPAWGFTYAYSVPADYLGWLRVDESAGAYDYKKVGRTVHTDATSVLIEYVARTENTDLFDSLFVEALVMRLAAYLVPGLGGEGAEQKAQNLRLWHERVVIPAARFADSMEQSTVVLDSNTWMDARNG